MKEKEEREKLLGVGSGVGPAATPNAASDDEMKI
jgi:hypothetical protein